MKTIKYPEKKDWQDLVKRPAIDEKSIRKIVKPILKKVKEKGDKALRKLTYEYDHVELDHILVSPSEIAAARKEIKADLKDAIHKALDNIEKFHTAQRQNTIEIETTEGVICKRKSIPIEKVGLYIPGGSAPLFSTILMLGIPARVAGCKQVVMCTPCSRSGEIAPAILYAADLVGIEMIAKVGGAQAIGAMAFGTKTIPKVDKIFGPGNQFVTAAKQVVSQWGTAIDMPAGPSELAIIADETAIPEFVAADLLSQAEHGADSQVILITTSEKLLNKVRKEINEQKTELPRKHIVQKSLEYARLILVNSIEEAVELSNFYAPEHLIIAADNEDLLAENIINAGSVFLGNYTPESAGDYASGTNHTLPTYGYARAYSGVSLDSFMKKITFQKISEAGLCNLGPVVMHMATAEKLEAHKKAVSIRLKYIQENEKS
jgi:histidinol dehydrogenase